MRVARRPDCARKLLPDRLLEPAVSVAGDVLYARQAPFRELLQKGLPGLLRLTECHVHAENFPLGLSVDANGQKHRSRSDSALTANLHAGGVEDKKGIFAFQRSPACGP